MQSTPEQRPGLLINRNFTLLWSGEVFSLLGDYIFETTLILWVGTVLAKGQPWAPLAVSGIILTTTLSLMIVGPIAGVFADRWNKRRTMIMVNILQAIMVLLLLFIAGVLPLPLGPLPLAWKLACVYVISFLISSIDQFFNQSATALINTIVPEEHLPLAMGRVWTMVSLGTIVGPAIAAPIFISFGLTVALLFNLATFLFSCVTLAAIRPPVEETLATPEERQGFFREFNTGLQTLLGTRVLLTMLVTGALLALGSSAVNALNLFFVQQNLHAPLALFGLVGTAIGLGSLVGSLLGARVVKWLGLRRTIWVSLLAIGVLVLVYARLTIFLPALALLFIMGIPSALFNVSSGALIYHATPGDMLGRTTAVRNSLVSISGVAGAALAGYLDSTLLHTIHISIGGMVFGSVDTIFMVTGLLTLLGGLYAMLHLQRPVATERPKTTPALE
jgi:MFS family permease